MKIGEMKDQLKNLNLNLNFFDTSYDINILSTFSGTVCEGDFMIL